MNDDVTAKGIDPQGKSHNFLWKKFSTEKVLTFCGKLFPHEKSQAGRHTS